MFKRVSSPLVVSLSMVVFVASPSDADDTSYVKNVWANANFLDQSSRLATNKASSKSLRRFAEAEASDQMVVANALVAWVDSRIPQSRTTTMERARDGSVIALPFRTAASLSAGVADSIDGLQTGRSVAVDGPAVEQGTPVRLPAINLPSMSQNAEHLSHLNGRAFDAFFKSTQLDALTQLSTLYSSYLQSGSDAGLRNLAIRELPKVNNAIADLRSSK